MSAIYRFVILTLMLSLNIAYANVQNHDSGYLQNISKAHASHDNRLEKFDADMSFVIFDLKYNNLDGVKICEIQPGGVSVFSGYDYLMEGNGLVPEMLCDFISKFQSNVWYTEKAICDKKCMLKFASMGWKKVNNVSELKKDKNFIKASLGRVKDPYNLNNYHGILYAKPEEVSLENLREKYPGVIIMDAALYSNIRNKHVMDALLKSSPKLSNLRPISKIYPKKYSKNLVHSIFQEIESDIFVIKPISSTKGQGVIIIDKDNLDSTLEYILSKENKRALSSNPESAYSYWASDKQALFLVEQFIESIPVEAPQFDNKLYDGTMRVVGLLLYHQQKVKFELLEAHWKLPKKSISDIGTITEKHKSFGNVPHFSHVDTAIIEKVKQQIEEAFAELYELNLSH